MRKMLQLKAAAEAAKAAKQQRQEQRGQQRQQGQQPGASPTAAAPRQQPIEQQQQQEQQHRDGLDRPQEHAAPAPAGKQAAGGKPGGGSAADQPLGQQTKLKARKKEYLQVRACVGVYQPALQASDRT